MKFADTDACGALLPKPIRYGGKDFEAVASVQIPRELHISVDGENQKLKKGQTMALSNFRDAYNNGTYEVLYKRKTKRGFNARLKFLNPKP